MTRTFVDHAGRLHRVEMSRDEINDRVRYWLTVPMGAVAMLIALTIAAGII